MDNFWVHSVWKYSLGNTKFLQKGWHHLWKVLLHSKNKNCCFAICSIWSDLQYPSLLFIMNSDAKLENLPPSHPTHLEQMCNEYFHNPPATLFFVQKKNKLPNKLISHLPLMLFIKKAIKTYYDVSLNPCKNYTSIFWILNDCVGPSLIHACLLLMQQEAAMTTVLPEPDPRRWFLFKRTTPMDRS